MKFPRFLHALLLVPCALLAQPGDLNITTLAGNGWFGTIDGPATAPARLNRPAGLALDTSGRVVFSEPASRTLRRLSGGVVSTFSGQAGASGTNDGIASLARFSEPTALATDADGNIYTLDLGPASVLVRRVATDGTVTTRAYVRPVEAGTAPTAAKGLAFGPGGVLALSETSNHTILKIAGDTVTVFHDDGSVDLATTPTALRSPAGLCFDSSGNLYVANSGAHAVLKIDAAGTRSVFAGLPGTSGTTDGAAAEARFKAPEALAFASDGSLWIADTGNHTLRKISTGGTVTTVVGFPGLPGENDGLSVPSGSYTGFSALLDTPVALAFDTSGNLFIADREGSTLRRLKPSLNLETIAGAAQVAGHVDGAAVAARVSRLNAAANDLAGNTYVSSSLDQTIRKIAPDGTISLYAGSPYTPGSANGPRAEARFSGPRGLAVDGAGNVIVVDRGNNIIRKIAVDGTVTTLAGLAGSSGSADGTGSEARFNAPGSVAVDGEGTLFVTDSGNNTIRRITADGIVTTLAGSPGVAGTTDGTGSAARFSRPLGITLANDGNFYVAEFDSHLIRKVTRSGEVTRVAGIPNTGGFSDGDPSVALFNHPSDITSNSYGDLLITDYFNHSIRVVTPDAQVVTVAGSSDTNVFGFVDGVGAAARFHGPSALSRDINGAVYIVDYLNASVRKGVEILTPPQITAQPSSVTSAQGTSVTLTATVSGARLGYQWYKGATAIAGATSASLVLNGIQISDAADYTVVVTNTEGSVTSRLARVTVGETVASRISNMSVRSLAGYNGSPLIVGFAVLGGDRQVLLRAMGPSLEVFGVNPFLVDPELVLHQTVGGVDTVVGSNDNWGDGGLSTTLSETFASVGAFAPPNPASTDAAYVAVVDGNRTVHINSHIPGASGVTLAEVYDLGTTNSPRLINVSARNHAGVGSETLIAGFVIAGNTPMRVLVRGIGPTLTAFGVPGALADPELTLHTSSNGPDRVIASNDNWNDEPGAAEAFTAAGAFALPEGSADSALVMTLPAGIYTAHLTGVSGSTGEALVEVYEVR